MANDVAKITGYVCREAARGFYNDRLFSGLITKDYSEEFKETGAKKGNQIFVRLPAQYNVRSGSTYAAQDVVERKVAVTLGEPEGIDFEFSTVEATIDIDNNKRDYSERFIKPAGSRLASHVDATGLEKMALEVNNTIVTAASPTLKDFLKSKAILNKNLAPKTRSERFAIIGSDVETELVDEVKVLFNSSKEISKAIKDGQITDMAGLTFATSDLCYVRTNGAGGASLAVGAYVEGSTSITLTGGVAAGLAVGDVIEFDDSNAVNPETKKPYANALQRTIKADLGGDVYTIDAIYGPQAYANGGIQNATAVPAGNADVLGVSGTDYLVSMSFHKEAFTLTSVDLVLPEKVEMRDRLVVDGMSIRYIKDYLIDSDALPNRLDIMYAFTAIHPEWAVRVETPLA